MCIVIGDESYIASDDFHGELGLEGRRQAEAVRARLAQLVHALEKLRRALQVRGRGWAPRVVADALRQVLHEALQPERKGAIEELRD